MDNIDQLEKLTNMLPKIGDMETKPHKEKTNIHEYDVKNGVAIGIGLYKTTEVAVQRLIISKDTEFYVHKHDVHEWAILYNGEIEVYLEGERYTYKSGDMIYFPPREPHKIIAKKDTYGIFITVPASKGYPNG